MSATKPFNDKSSSEKDSGNPHLKKQLSSISSNQLKVPQKSILSAIPKRPNILKIVLSGIDVTPIPILPSLYKGGRERQLKVFDSENSHEASEAKAEIGSGRMQDILNLSKRGESYMTNLFTKMSGYDASSDEDMEGYLRSSVDFCVAPVAIPKMPETITLVLNETDTEFILDIPSATVEKDTPEGVTVEAENEHYKYLTVGKGRNRKTCEAEVQTIPILQKSRESDAKRNPYVSTPAFASLWEMYDTYHEDKEDNLPSLVKIPFKSLQLSNSFAAPKEDLELAVLMQNYKFLDAICIMQRILANNVFNEQQKRFRGLCDPSLFREDIEYNYKLNLLWTFSNEDTKDRCVTAMSWNPGNKDILAVGYGKFFYDDESTGLVLIWNIKNPVQPERYYTFPVPVTSLDFSKQNPNLLAIGFYNGDIFCLNILIRQAILIGKNNKEETQLFEPIWQLVWYTDQDYYEGKEFLAATCQDGKIFKFAINKQNLYMQGNKLMHITNAEGKLKGIETIRKCPTKAIPITRYSPALVYSEHPADPNIYYVGTGEGYVHICSKNYYHQHLDLFLAHDSPIYSIEFSPFCSRLFLTCGDDWAVRLWAVGISEPLFEMKKKMHGVQGVAWSPSHPTIMAMISGTEIFIWDLQRKTYDSQSSTNSPTKSRNTLVKFTDDGRCLLVADIDGNVHVFSLEDMPFIPFYPENLLTQSIKNALNTRPDLLNKIEKLGSLSFEDEYDRFKS